MAFGGAFGSGLVLVDWSHLHTSGDRIRARVAATPGWRAISKTRAEPCSATIYVLATPASCDFATPGRCEQGSPTFAARATAQGSRQPGNPGLPV
jgi:hypothetical protein